MNQRETKEAAEESARSRRRKRLWKHEARARSRQRKKKLLHDVRARRRQVSSLGASDVLEGIELVKTGVPANVLPVIAEDMAIPRDRLYATIGLVRATVNRKLREQKPLSQDESERVLGMARLINQVDTMVRESGDADRFDAAKWVARWLDRPHPALGGRRPAELMDTADGRSHVSDLVAQMESAAYA